MKFHSVVRLTLKLSSSSFDYSIEKASDIPDYFINSFTDAYKLSSFSEIRKIFLLLILLSYKSSINKGFYYLL